MAMCVIYGVSMVVDVVYPGAAPSEAEQVQMTSMCWPKKKMYNIFKINLKYSRWRDNMRVPHDHVRHIWCIYGCLCCISNSKLTNLTLKCMLYVNVA